MKLLELHGRTSFPVVCGDGSKSVISYLTETKNDRPYLWAIEGVTEAEARATFEKYLQEQA